MKYSQKQALYKLAAYCSTTERAEYDVRRKLEFWEIKPKESSEIIKRLYKENFLNEERYCRSFVKDKSQFNKWGKIKIAIELKKKRISENIITKCLAEIDQDSFSEQLIQILGGKMKTVKAKNSFERRTKLIRFALGRGFSLDEIKHSLKKLNLDEPEEKEYMD